MAHRREVEPPPDDRIPLIEVEAVVRSVPGVDRAKVVVNDWGAIESIHVIGDTARPAKRVVRDIESALAAKVGILVDHRRISLAQVNAPGTRSGDPRLTLIGYGLEVDSLAGRSWVHVRLGRTDRPEVVFEGAADAGAGGGAQAAALVRATARALEQAVPDGVRIEPGRVRPVAEAEATIWLCTLIVERPGVGESLAVGASVEGTSRDEAVVRAALAAALQAAEGLSLREVAPVAEDASGPDTDGDEG